KIPHIYYNILAAIKNDIKYIRDTPNKKVVFNYEGKKIAIPVKKFIKLEKILIDKINNSSGTFEIRETEDLLEQLQIKTIKEKSLTKGDIQLQIHDDFTGFKPVLSFSIKSYLGSNPTLLNASNGTVVSYEPTRKLAFNEMKKINKIDGRSKVKNR